MEEDKVIVVYPGFWSGPEGEEALVFMSLKTTSYKEFLDEVHKLVEADQKVFEYVLHCFIQIEQGLKKSFIMSDKDLQRVAKIFKTPTIHVSTKPKRHAHSFNHVPMPMHVPFYPLSYPSYLTAPNYHGVPEPYIPGPGPAPVVDYFGPGSENQEMSNEPMPAVDKSPLLDLNQSLPMKETRDKWRVLGVKADGNSTDYDSTEESSSDC